tara:strand:- start:35941 stop:36171 length:231 start_codon:yes stop_codon:yes gene_type:complete
MDISIIRTENGTQIYPSTIHGMLWLQTHFENSDWEIISKKQAIIPNEMAKELVNDALEAGITFNSIPVFSSNYSNL